MQTRGYLQRAGEDDSLAELQASLVGYMAQRGSSIVGAADTRTGHDPTHLQAATRGALTAEARLRHESDDACDSASQPTVQPHHWDAAGATKTEGEGWRGGTALLSLGTAKKRMASRLDDARQWGRYVGRFYTGEGKRTLLIVEAYVPVSAYNSGASGTAYAHELGRRAGEYTGGVAKTRWQVGDPMPNPTRDQIAHPKRLMMADLALHLRAYADNPHCTVVLMGDMNVDRDRDQGTEDATSLETMLAALHLRSCADIRWGTAARRIATRVEGSSRSHIDHAFITDTAATSVDEFAVDEDSGLGTDHGDERGLDHHVLVVDLDVRSLLGVGVDAPKAVATKRRASIKYSDKARVDRFRQYATDELTRRDMDGALTALIGDLTLDTALRDRGHTERDLDEGAPWESLRWQRRWNPSEDDGTLRWRISTALEVLDTLAHVADEGFESTHGGAHRKRGTSNPARWGNGLSDQAKHASAIYVRMRRMIGQVRAGAYWQAEQTRHDLAKLGVQLGAVDPDPARKDAVVDKLLEQRDSFRRLLQGRDRVRYMLERGDKAAKAQTRRLRAATKREIDVVMDRPVRQVLATVQTGSGATRRVITDPVAVATECCNWSARRMDLMQPKWFRRHDLEVGHEAWHASDDGVRAAVIMAIDNDGHYTVRHHADDSTHKGVRRALLCIEAAFDNPTAADIAGLTTTDHPEDTALLMRRNAEGRRCRLRATESKLRPQDKADIPAQFWPLLPHFQRKVIPSSDERVQQSDYSSMLTPDGLPKPVQLVEWQRKMGDIAKGKAPGYSGNTPDLYASLPIGWHEWALKLANVIQHTGVTPNGWHIDLVCYIHKGGDDGSLSNHRPLCLIEVLRKVATSISTDRMRRDWNRMHLLDDANPGFQAGRTTANSILPLRLAAEHCVATKQHFAALLDDLKWCFDTPARTIVELALMRLGVPSYYYEMLEDIDLHSAKTTVTASGLTCELVEGAAGVHKQLHGTGQGTVEGPLTWIPIADIVIAVAAESSTQPIMLPSPPGGPVPVDKTWYVDDSALMQAGVTAMKALRRMANMTGLMYYFLGLERRAKKCILIRLAWEAGRIQRARERNESLELLTWLVVWTTRGPVITSSKPVRIVEYDCDQEFRHLGYSASVLGSSKKAEAALRTMAVRAAEIHASKPALRLCGVNIAQAVITAKVVYPSGFGKSTAESIEHIERAYRPMIKRSLGVASSFPNDVFHAATEHDGLGIPRLLDEITKTRLRHFQSMIASRNSSERQLAKASLLIAQRWFGHSEPVTAPSARLTHLFEPVDARAPQAAHMMHELRQLGHSLSVGWEHVPYADDDETILEAAIPDGASLTGPELKLLQRWRREHDLVWVSELLRCDGLTPLTSVTAAKAGWGDTLRALIDRAIDGPARVRGPRVGGPTLAAWNGVRVGHWLFAMGRLGQVTDVEEDGVIILASSLFEEGERVVRKRKIRELLTTTDLIRLRYTSPPIRMDTAEHERDGVVSVDHDELGAAQDLERLLRQRWGRADGLSETNRAYHDTPHTGPALRDHAAIPQSVDILGFGSHYLSRMSQAAHALVHGELFDDPEVKRATLEAETLAAQMTDAHPGLDAYSDGGVAGSGAEGSGAAIIRFGGTDVTLNIRLVPVGRRLSSGRAEWVGLLLILAVLRRIKATVTVRLDNIQVVNAYNDGQWAYERNLLRRNDRDLALMCWSLMAARERDGLGRVEAKHQKGHAERRKKRADFDTHEVYNDKVDAATHTASKNDTVYVSFAPLSTDRTGVWYEPLETENVGAGTAYEVTSDAYRHIALASQRRTANRYMIEKDGLFLATFSQGALGRSAKEGTAVRTTKMMHGHLPTAARMAMWGGDKDGSVECACGKTLEWENGKVAHLQNHMFACGCPEERAARARWATAVRTLTKSAIKHDRVDAVSSAVMACWGADGSGDIATAAEDERNGWRPTEMTQGEGDLWHFSGTSTFDENAHWGGFPADEADGDELHEQGHIRAPDGMVAYDKDWDGIDRATDKVTASLRMLHRVRSMVDTSRWWMMKWPVAAVGFLATAMGTTPDAGHKYIRRLRALTVKHMGELWTAQVTRRRAEDDSEVMTDLREQWNDVRRFTARMPTWASVSKTHVFRIRNLLLKWRRKAAAADARQPKITQWLTSDARERRGSTGTAGRPTAQQAQAEARASRMRRREQSARRTATLQGTMRRWVRGAPNGTNDADHTPPEDDLAPDLASRLATADLAGGAASDAGSATAAHDAADLGIDLDWLPEPGRTQAMHGKAAAYDDTGRCAYHLSPHGCTLLDGECGDGTGLLERYGRRSELSSNRPPDGRADPPAGHADAQANARPSALEATTEVLKRSADHMTWCERCAVGIHFYCAQDYALAHGDDCHGYYGRRDVATNSGLCYDCWSTHRPYMDDSDEDADSDYNPKRHPNRLRWHWPGRLKAALDAEARRERSASARGGGSQAADGGRAARRAGRAADTGGGSNTRRPMVATARSRPRRPAPRRSTGAAQALGNAAVRSTLADRHASSTAAPPPGSHPAPLPPPEPPPTLHPTPPPPPEPPPTLHPAPLPPPEPPPDPGPLESDDDDWTPYHIPAPPATAAAPDARTDGSGRPPTPPEDTTSADAAPAKRRKRNPKPKPPDPADLSQPNLHRWFPQREPGPAASPRAAAEHTEHEPAGPPVR